ncbi:MAG: SDR family NAD(P)-dependent oxidoreductase [Rubrivivax sp.]|jgi:3-oxoacyl-[acyl-carrier protein] reductase
MVNQQEGLARVALVTGGSSGVGAAVARRLAAQGTSVLVNFSRDAGLARQVVDQCEALGAQAMAVKGDVAQDQDCVALVEAALARWGRLDALVNCAGTTQFVPMPQLDGVQAQDFQRIYGVNAIGPFQMARAAARHMPAGSAVVNVSSVAGQIGSGSSFPYVMSKAALNILTVGLARVLAPRIRVNAVLPGLIEGRWMRDGLGDDMYERVKAQYSAASALGRVSEPDHIASAVCWLLEPDCLVTGQQIVVDAGFVLGKLPSAAGPTRE